MSGDEGRRADVRDIALDVADIWPDYKLTPLIELPALARLARVRRVLVKLECERPLGNFKALGGMVAALRALARVADGVAGVARLPDLRGGGLRLPSLVCASAGNHGLAVAAAARWAGTRATVYLSESANPARAARIEALGARTVWIPGTYDDAVAQAARDDGLVIADTSADPDDPVVRDVMDGYSLIARELTEQIGRRAGISGGATLAEGNCGQTDESTALGKGATSECAEAGEGAEAAQRSSLRPTHLFVQAGVGGLAAALTEGARAFMQAPHRVVVVEPQSAACVAAALIAGQAARIKGELRTSAEMLACGLASAPAVKVLRAHGVSSVLVAEELLQQTVRQLQQAEGPLTTPSGATGLAGLLHVSSSEELRELHQLSEESCVLLVVTEGAAPNTATILGTS